MGHERVGLLTVWGGFLAFRRMATVFLNGVVAFLNVVGVAGMIDYMGEAGEASGDVSLCSCPNY